MLLPLFFVLGGLDAQARNGGARAQARRSVNTGNVNRNIDRDINQNVNRDVNRNVNRDIDVHGGYGGGYGCCYRPVARTAAVVGTAAVTAAVVGSVARSLPANCAPVAINGLTYQQCGNTWYQPQLSGGSTTYLVVDPP